jgi:hypothetical protein
MGVRQNSGIVKYLFKIKIKFLKKFFINFFCQIFIFFLFSIIAQQVAACQVFDNATLFQLMPQFYPATAAFDIYIEYASDKGDNTQLPIAEG